MHNFEIYSVKVAAVHNIWKPALPRSASRTRRNRASLSSTTSASSTGFICLLDNAQHDSVIGSLVIKNFILSKRSGQGRPGVCLQRGEPAAPRAVQAKGRQHHVPDSLWECISSELQFNCSLMLSIAPPATLFKHCASARAWNN